MVEEGIQQQHCIRSSRQVYGHTHCTVRWFPLIEACLDVRCELEEGRCSRVSGSEVVLILAGERNSLIEGKMSASRTLAAGHSSEMGLYEVPCDESLPAWESG